MVLEAVAGAHTSIGKFTVSQMSTRTTFKALSEVDCDEGNNVGRSSFLSMPRYLEDLSPNQNLPQALGR